MGGFCFNMSTSSLIKGDFNADEAHSAHYDASKTAELFCEIINKWREIGGWSDQFGR